MLPVFQLILSHDAAADLQALHHFIGKDSPANADKTLGRILDAIAGL